MDIGHIINRVAFFSSIGVTLHIVWFIYLLMTNKLYGL